MPFAATNLIWPVSMGIAAIGFYARNRRKRHRSKTLGEGKKEKANQYFSMILYFGIIVSVIFRLSVLSLRRKLPGCSKRMANFWNIASYTEEFFLRRRRRLFCRICFKAFLVAAEEPVLSPKINIAAGLTNVVFDYLFIAAFEWGVAGAAIATGMGQIVGGIAPFFFCERKPQWAADHLENETV